MERTLDELETPVALVEVDRVHANLRGTADYCRAHGLGWRPHAKTHKVPTLASWQIEAGALGLTVATPREAEVMASVAGDLLLAYPPFGDARLERLMEVARSARLTVGLDSAAAVRGGAEDGGARGRGDRARRGDAPRGRADARGRGGARPRGGGAGRRGVPRGDVLSRPGAPARFAAGRGDPRARGHRPRLRRGAGRG